MTVQGIIKGKTIELAEDMPYAQGERVSVTVEPANEPPIGSARALLEALRQSPPLQPGDVEALERSIEEGKLPLSPPPRFD